MKFNFTTQLCFLQDCYLPFEHVILMTTDYDRKLVQKLAILIAKMLVHSFTICNFCNY